MANSRANRFGYRPLPGSSGRYENIMTGETISNRQMDRIARTARTGENVSKERYTKQIKTGERRYADAATERRQIAAARTRLYADVLKAAQTGARINEYSGPGQLKTNKRGGKR